MFIVIEHDIHDPEDFKARGETVFPLPDDLTVHHFLPSIDLSRAWCLYEAPSVERLQGYLDTKLARSSTQRYFPVHTEVAMGLPGH